MPSSSTKDATATGRYGLHIHNCLDDSRGTMIEGMVIRNASNHAYVPHLSHGITFKDCIGYTLVEHATWWDDTPENATHDITFDGCIMARMNENSSSLGGGYQLQIGDRNVIKNCVAVGIGGDPGRGSNGGFIWPSGANQVWTFNENNISHNNRQNGIWNWQVSDFDHVLENFVCYHNAKSGIEHGSYQNHYLFRNGTCYGNAKGALDVQAIPKSGVPIRFENMIFDGAGISDAVVVYKNHVFTNTNRIPYIFLNCTIQGQKTGGKAVYLYGVEGNSKPEIIDFIDCTIVPNEFYFDNGIEPTSLIRVQNGSTAFELRRYDQSGTLIPAWNARKTDIAPFYNESYPYYP